MFRDAVRARDGGCIITRRRPMRGRWNSLEATHIVPLAWEEHWKALDFGSLITFPPAKVSHGTINSIENGLMLDTTIRGFFDSYLLSINPKV